MSRCNKSEPTSSRLFCDDIENIILSYLGYHQIYTVIKNNNKCMTCDDVNDRVIGILMNNDKRYQLIDSVDAVYTVDTTNHYIIYVCDENVKQVNESLLTKRLNDVILYGPVGNLGDDFCATNNYIKDICYDGLY